MSVLSVKRRNGQRVQIAVPGGKPVWVWCKWDRGNGDRVVLTVDAPPEYRVLREELVPPGEEYTGRGKDAAGESLGA